MFPSQREVPMQVPIFVPALVLTLLLPALAWADSMRCNRRLVGEGTSQYEVLLHCGEPAYRQIVREPVLVQRVTQAQVVSGEAKAREPILQMDALESETQFIEIERWTYHPASGRLIREVDFLDGKIRRINTTGRAP